MQRVERCLVEDLTKTATAKAAAKRRKGSRQEETGVSRCIDFSWPDMAIASGLYSNRQKKKLKE